MHFKCVEAQMRPGSTIEGLIRFYNHLDMTKEEIDFCVDTFSALNSHARPPRPHQIVDMPVLIKYAK